MWTIALTRFVPLCRRCTKKGKSTIQKRTRWKCGKYHSTIKARNSDKITCNGYEDGSVDEESEEDEDGDEENEDD